MDRRERLGSMEESLAAMGEGLQANMWTALPGIIQSFDPTKRTAVVQPSVQAQRTLKDFTTQWVTLPLLLDCPVVFPGGGDAVMTFPLKKGDECLVVFSSRCIDAWWQNGGVQVQAELRMHDLSDGFCLPGPASVPKVEAAISPALATLRSRDGQALISLDPAGHEIHVTVPGADIDVKNGEVDITTTNKVHVTAANTSLTMQQNNIQAVVGAAVLTLTPTGITLSCSGAAAISMTASGVTITGTVNIEGREFLTHTHTDPQGGNTGGVV